MFFRSTLSGRLTAAFRSIRATLAVPSALMIAALGWLAATPAQAQTYYWGGFSGKAQNPGFALFPPRGVGSEPTLSLPQGLAVDSADGAIYVADTDVHLILKVLPNGTVSVIAGRTFETGSIDAASGPNARFNKPAGVTVDASRNVYVADSGNGSIRKITPAGAVSTVKTGLTAIRAIAAAPTGTLYFIRQNGLYSIDPAVMNPTPVVVADALLTSPWALAVDASNGDLYVADRFSFTILKRSGSGGAFSVLAGATGVPGNVDANGTAARFQFPLGVAVDPVTKDVYVVDSLNYAVRKINSAAEVTTIGGAAANQTAANGTGANAGFEALTAVALGRNGEVYAIDNIAATGGRITRGVEVTGAISLAAPTAAAPYGGTFPVTFTLPSAAAAGSVKLYLDDGVQNVFRCTFSNANATAGPHSFTVNSLNPIASAGGNVTVIDRLRFGTAIFAATYTATLEYNDAVTGKPVFTLPTPGVVIDTTPPVFAETRDFIDTLEATSPNGAAVVFDQGVSDALSGVNANTVSFKRDNTTAVVSGAFFPIGQSTLDLSAADNVGNVATKQLNIFVQDTIAPSATAPGAITVLAGTDGNAQVGNLSNLLTNVSDAGTASPEITQSITEFQNLPIGRYPITFTVKDSSFNSVTVGSTLIIAFPPVNAPVVTGSKTAGPVAKGTPLGAPVPGAVALGLDAAASIGTFFTPAISDRRDLVARAILLNGTKKLGAIYRENGAGTGSIVALAGGLTNPADASSSKWKSFLDPLMAGDGSITFSAKLADPSLKATEDEGLWTSGLPFAGAPLSRVLWEGHEVGIGAGILLKSITSVSVRNEEIVALVKLAGTGVAKTNDQALLRLTPNANLDGVVVTSLLRTGDNAPTNLDGKVSSIAAFVPGFGAPGQGNTHADTGVVVRVKTDAKGEGVARIRDDGNFLLLSSNKLPISILGNAVPTKFNPPSFSGGGFAARYNGKFIAGKAGDVVELQDGAGMAAYVAVGDASPIDPAIKFKTLGDPVGNAANAAVFRATLSGVGVKAPADSGLFERTFAGQRLIVRGGALSTNAAGTTVADTAFKKFLNYALPETGGTIFVAEITGKSADGKPFTASSKRGLWAEHSAIPGQLHLLLQGGQDVTVGGNVKKLATFRLLDALPGSFGSRRSYNTGGSVAVLATFTDKSQAILRVDIP